jgi:S-formylglutathione hydrolase FrmB
MLGKASLLLTFAGLIRLSPMPKTLRHPRFIATVLSLFLVCYALPLHAQSSKPAPAATATPWPQPESTKRVQDVKFFSKTLQREMPYRVILPKDYFTTEIRYPVLYLLHGYTGHYRSFESHSNLTRYLDRYQIIVVSIEGENSWYINSPTNPKEKWEDYFLHDVISDAQERFRINGGDARAIAGISMGGYAAINIALKNPGLFFFASSLSGPLDAPRNPEFDQFPGFDEVFGSAGSKAHTENDLFLLAEKAEPQHTSFIFMTCGTEDDDIDSMHKFSDLLRKRHIAYEMTESPGEHEWIYWESAIPQMLRSLARRMPDVAGVDLR